ncbi:hypothetical protein GRS48_12595 [Halorubrum sp. JWXQ-INN 858]|uniref:hypothetical protein n=1 Tax=Halorubrum sp. JWXQ-INN 858 TaxID=2690782 RepID=UPI001357A811|nr:hypothetical protein [Halorubrum sp. JWXQ-INN 858]MWV65651.1 hypothetical protein [Halorubrum sp. JWXQ-INN 858]
MRGGDSPSDLTTTSIKITEEQKHWIESNRINLSAYVRDVIEASREMDDFDSGAALEAALSERELLQSRCERLEQLLREEEAVEDAVIDSARHGAGDDDE